MSDETKLRECKTLAKLIAIGDSTAGADLCQRVDKAADLIASQSTQLSQALRELEAARSHGSALLRDVEHAEAQRDTALRELGEARKCIAEMEARPYKLSGDSNRLYRYLNGLDIDDLDERAEELMRSTIDGTMVGPLNRNSIKAAIATHFHELRSDREAALRANAELRGALEAFKDCADTFDESTPDSFPLFSFNEDNEMEELEIELGDLRKARTALEAIKK